MTLFDFGIPVLADVGLLEFPADNGLDPGGGTGFLLKAYVADNGLDDLISEFTTVALGEGL